MLNCIPKKELLKTEDEEFVKLKDLTTECAEWQEELHHLQHTIGSELESTGEKYGINHLYFGPKALCVDPVLDPLIKRTNPKAKGCVLQDAKMNHVFGVLHGNHIRDKYLHWVTDFVNLIMVAVIGKLTHKDIHQVHGYYHEGEVSWKRFLVLEFNVFTYYFVAFTLYFVHNSNLLRFKELNSNVMEDLFMMLYTIGLLLVCVFLPVSDKSDESDGIHDGLSYTYFFHLFVMIGRSGYYYFRSHSNSYASHYLIQQIITYVIGIVLVALTFATEGEADVPLYFAAFAIIFLAEACTYLGEQANTNIMIHNLGIFCCVIIGEVILFLGTQNFEQPSTPDKPYVSLEVSVSMLFTILLCFIMMYFIFVDIFVGFYEATGFNNNAWAKTPVNALVWMILNVILGYGMLKIGVYVLIFLEISKPHTIKLVKKGMKPSEEGKLFSYCLSNMMIMLPIIFGVIWAQRYHYTTWKSNHKSLFIRIALIAFFLTIALLVKYCTTTLLDHFHWTKMIFPLALTMFFCVADMYSIRSEVNDHESHHGKDCEEHQKKHSLDEKPHHCINQEEMAKDVEDIELSNVENTE